ncbi:ABC transporter permease subunit [Thermoflavimicrobium daqui]|uniref:ABC transmembrane type-1 domain-containing protein n=1 Tax=Thermoflavimicrobium daqui TaxID=2137476 RepID=A0A364K9L9_9BACL|nr:ABC transporter permease subunit [Thermoflavimicrobium daqui]RAL26983.1 hypothetical protein DL897_02795 [Thermoflavimicrobium daqui]
MIRKLFHGLYMGTLWVIILLVISTFPFLFSYDGNSFSFNEQIFTYVKNYFSGLLTGESFQYKWVADGFVLSEYSIWDEWPDSFVLSAVFLILTGIVAMGLGLFVGLWLAKRKAWVKDIFGFLSLLPDFFVGLLLCVLVIVIFQSTGILVAEVAATGSETAILLPFITLAYIPFMYMIRMVSFETYHVLTEDYILIAKAKGLSKWHIYSQHVIRNILPFVKADLFKICGMMIGSMYIVERIFNLRGVTKLFFLVHKWDIQGQYNIVTYTLLALMVIFFITYVTMRLLILLFEKIFAD